jgi:NCAIR mutase (PurE)-related protein
MCMPMPSLDRTVKKAGKPGITIVTGTADIPVAEEAAVTAEHGQQLSVSLTLGWPITSTGQER